MKRTVLAAGFLALFAAPTLAGELVLKNGDRLTGEVVRLEDGKLVFKTGYGEVTVPKGEVVSLRMGAKKNIRVGEGPALEAAIETDEKGAFDWKGNEATLAEVVSILPPPKPPVRLSEPERWSGNLGFSVTWTDGNTHTLTYHTELNLLRDQSQAVEDFKNKLNINLKYDYGKSSDDLNARKGSGAVKWEWFCFPRFGVYVEASWFYDYFAGIERKNTTGAGFSAKLIERDEIKVNFDLGVSYLGTFYNDKTIASAVASGTTPVTFEEYPAGRAALEVIWKLPLGLDFRHKTVAYQSLRDQGKHNVESETSFSRKISGAWFFKLSARYKYVEPPAPGKIRWDATYLFSVVFKF